MLDGVRAAHLEAAYQARRVPVQMRAVFGAGAYIPIPGAASERWPAKKAATHWPAQR